jgi:mono/diheme cytochrome c family protein
MRRILKVAGIALGSLVVLLAAVVAVLYARGQSRTRGGDTIAVRPIADPGADSALVARGRHLAEAVTPCAVCHGPGLGGQPFPTPAMLVSMSAPNLTRGRGGIGASYSLEDWDRAVRHGVAKDGRRLLIMPSEAYANMSDADFAALAAYVRSVPPVDKEHQPRRVGVLGAALVGAGAFPLAANTIGHSAVGSSSVPAGVTTEYGGYLVGVAGCNVCHAANLQGLKGNNGPPPGPNLLTGAGTWAAEQFRSTIRNGMTPGGRKLDAEQMPWPAFAHMTDDELEAIRLYIASLAAKA